MLEQAKTFRRKMTPAEARFWEMVRAHRLGGLHFRRQQPLLGFIADFYCDALRLVVEIDGGIHDQQVEYDREREATFLAHGLTVMRFRNNEIFANPAGVWQALLKHKST